LTDEKWIDHIYPPVSQEEVKEFVSLWEATHNISLDDTAEDDITWRWTADEEYSTQSAYQIQFSGTFSKIRITPIWKTRAEPKCHFFAWTLMHNKILTANNLIKHGWANDPDCRLCGNYPETPSHLCKDCPFAQQTWDYIRQWFGLATLISVNSSGSMQTYWWKCRRKFEKSQRRRVDAIPIYF